MNLISYDDEVLQQENQNKTKNNLNWINQKPTVREMMRLTIYNQSFDIDQNKTGDKTIRNSLDWDQKENKGPIFKFNTDLRFVRCHILNGTIDIGSYCLCLS